MDVRDIGKFRHPLSDEETVGIVICTLLDGIVYPNCICPGNPSLHLDLGEVYAWLEIKEYTCKVRSDTLPGKPQVLGSK